MKTAILILFLACIGLIAALGFHILQYKGGVDIIAKDYLTFRHTWVDVREWDLADYIRGPKRIRDYMLYEKKDDSLKRMISEKQREWSEKTEGVISSAREKLRPLEQALHDWLSERLEN